MTSASNRRSIRLLVIVAKERDTAASAHVIGAFNDDFMTDLPLEDAEEQIERLKQTWTGEPGAYEFREVTITADFDLDDLFVSAEIEGRVESGL